MLFFYSAESALYAAQNKKRAVSARPSETAPAFIALYSITQTTFTVSDTSISSGVTSISTFDRAEPRRHQTHRLYGPYGKILFARGIFDAADRLKLYARRPRQNRGFSFAVLHGLA